MTGMTQLWTYVGAQILVVGQSFWLFSEQYLMGLECLKWAKMARRAGSPPLSPASPPLLSLSLFLSLPIPLSPDSLSTWLPWPYSKHDTLGVRELLTWQLEQKQKLSGLLKIRPRACCVTSTTCYWSSQSQRTTQIQEKGEKPNRLMEGWQRICNHF